MKLTDENEAQVNKMYAQMKPKFKPVFGETSHIALCEYMDRVTRDEGLYKKHLAQVRMVSKYRKQLFDSKVRALNQLRVIIKEEPVKSEQVEENNKTFF